MSNPFKYLNNILYGLHEGTSLLIQFYQTKDPCIWANAMLKGDHKSILLTHLLDKELLPHIDLLPLFKLCDDFDEICYEKDESKLSSLKTLKNIDLVFEGWSKFYQSILKITLLELNPYLKEFKDLEGEDLKLYCHKLLAYEEDFYNPKYIDHFVYLIHRHIKEKKAAYIAVTSSGG